MPATCSIVGSGVGITANSVTKTNTISANDTVAASHGLTSAIRSRAFIELPAAWSAPATRMKG